jgi:hypothetical protein
MMDRNHGTITIKRIVKKHKDRNTLYVNVPYQWYNRKVRISGINDVQCETRCASWYAIIPFEYKISLPLMSVVYVTLIED